MILPLAVLLLSARLAPQDASLLRDSWDWKADALALLAEGEVDRALLLLERAVAAEPRDAEAQRLLARALERLVGEGGSPLALGDARDAWDRALALEPFDLEALRGAIGLRLRLGEHEPAAALATRALGSAWLTRGELPADLLALACRARIGVYRQRAAASLGAVLAPDPGLRERELSGAWAALEHARALAPANADMALIASELLEAEGLPERAAEVLAGAIEQSSAEAPLHARLIDIHLRAGIEERLPALYEGWSTSGTNATLSWYAGYVRRLSGDLAQRERRFRDALGDYARCGEWMRVALTLEPSFRETSEAIRFQAAVSSVWCEIESGELERASRRALELLQEEPARRDEQDGLGRSLMYALSALGERRVQQSDYEHAAAEARAVVAAVPDDGTWWNNLGFLLREHSTQVESGAFPEIPARESRSREIYRESWQAYLRAVELQPDDARVVNDAALIQVYHLRDELARAEELLRQAIRTGEAALTALGESPAERQRFPLAQAVGDAYLNLGYLYYHVYRLPERSREFFARALASDSGDRSNLDQYLAAIDGRREPVPEQDRGRFVQPPALAQPAQAAIPWEGSLSEARARARSEQRLLLVYNRGDALGLAIPFLDELVTGADFAARSRGAVLVVCDPARRTFVDRRHDGRRVACPQWPPLTCSEHQRCAQEFAAWQRELTGAEPGESEEGLFVLRPGGERPERLASLEELGQLSLAGDELPPAPFEAVEASLGGEDALGEARALVAGRSQATRESVERILWEGFSSSPARGHLLAALAEDDQPASRELLEACLLQTVDPELELAAIGVWPAGAGAGPLQHALCWSPSEVVRAAARAALERERADDPALRARRVLEYR